MAVAAPSGRRRSAHLTGWSSGPLLAGLPVVPTFAGALAVCGFLKLIGLAAEGR